METKDLKKIMKEKDKKILKLEKKISKLEAELRIKKRKRLRVKDIVEMYSIPKSTISNYIEQGLFKTIHHSEKVMTLDAKEVDKFFTTVKKIKSEPKEKTNNLQTRVKNAKTVKESELKGPKSPLKLRKLK